MPKSLSHRSLLDWNDDDPEAHKVTTPRSVRALKAAGVLSSELMMKSLQEFEEPGILPDIVKIRFDHFKARRQEILRDVMRHYQATGDDSVTHENSGGHQGSALAMQQSEGAEKLRQVLEQEQRTTEMLKNRQKQEIEQMLLYELKMQAKAQENEMKIQKQKEKEAALLREKARRQAEEDEFRAKKEEMRRQQEEAQQSAAQKLALEMKKKAQQLAEAEAAAAEQRKQDALRREKELKEKHDAMKAEQEAAAAANAAKMEALRADMERKDRERKAKQEEAKRQKAAELDAKARLVAERQAEKDRQQAKLKAEQDRIFAEKTAQAQKRLQEFESKRLREQEERREHAARKAAEIQAGIDRMNALEAERLNTIMSKEQEVQHRLALAAEQKKVEELQKQQALDASNAARAEALRCAKEAEKRRQEELIEKQKADEQRMKEMKAARAREHAIKQEMMRLSKQDKLDAVERLRRQDEFKLEETRRKMKEDEARLAEIHAQRAALVEKRILLRQEQAEQKKLLMEAVETMKKTKKWEAPPGITMDIDVESLVSKVQNERSAGTLPAIPAAVRPSESTSDVAATSSADKRPKSRAKDPSNVSHTENSLPVPHPPVVEKPIEKSQQSPRLVLSASQQKAVSKPKRQLTEAKVRHKTKGAGSSGALSQSELALIAVDELRRSQNDALLRVLEEEQRKEKEREAMLSAVAAADLNERSRLDRVFAVERARASDRIMRLTAEHEMALIQRMGQLGFD